MNCKKVIFFIIKNSKNFIKTNWTNKNNNPFIFTKYIFFLFFIFFK